MGKRTPSKWLTLLAACFGLLMLYIDLFIVNVALPTIAQDFRAPLGTVSWTVSRYVLMIGVLPMGIRRLGDLWGQRVVYLAGVALFSIASLLCGLASSMTALIVFRMHDACCDERRPDEAVGAGLWNAWEGVQYRDRLWRRGAEPGLSLPYQLDAAILPHARPSSSRSVHGLWRRREPRDDRSSDPARV